MSCPIGFTPQGRESARAIDVRVRNIDTKTARLRGVPKASERNRAKARRMLSDTLYNRAEQRHAHQKAMHMKISGTTRLIAHLGYPTATFRAPMIYNPYFAAHGIDAVVVPMGCRAEGYADVLRVVTSFTNFLGALVTMPHKITTVDLADRVSTAVKICGACNAIRLGADGKIEADMFDGEGFVRGLMTKGRTVAGARAFVAGCGGAGSAISASLAAAGVAVLALHDTSESQRDRLAGRLSEQYPELQVITAARELATYDIVVNATPLGMKRDDPLPLPVDEISPEAIVGDVVLSQAMTPFLRAAAEHGCATQVGLDMLFEQIPAYLSFFGLPTTTADELRRLVQLPDD